MSVSIISTLFCVGGINFNYNKLTLSVICIEISQLAHN